jgi:lysophospholipid acyltransferase (LPLAT)-like uncharacterized protein
VADERLTKVPADPDGDDPMRVVYGRSSSPQANLAGLPAAKPRNPVPARIIGALVSWLLRGYHLSWRKEDQELAQLDRVAASGERILVVFWHGKYVPLFSLLSGRTACIFASDTFRGKVIAEISRRFGYDCILLPDGGGTRSLSLIREAFKLHRAGAIAVDGPLGPFHVVKRGVLDLASELGYVILPVSAASKWKTIISSRWDRGEITQPFSHVVLAVGEPIRVPSSMAPKDVMILKEQVRASLEALDHRAEKRVRSRR